MSRTPSTAITSRSSKSDEPVRRWPVASDRWPVAGDRWPVASGRWPVAGGRYRWQAAVCSIPVRIVPRCQLMVNAGSVCGMRRVRSRATPYGTSNTGYWLPATGYRLNRGRSRGSCRGELYS
jgi:hypothetical protein